MLTLIFHEAIIHQSIKKGAIMDIDEKMTTDERNTIERETAWEKVYENDVTDLLVEGYELVRSTGEWLSEVLDSDGIADEVMTLIYIRTVLENNDSTLKLPNIKTLSRSYLLEYEKKNEERHSKFIKTLPSGILDNKEQLETTPKSTGLSKLFKDNQNKETWKQLWPTITEKTDSPDAFLSLYDSDYLLWRTHSMPVFVELLSYAKIGQLTDWKTGVSKERGVDFYLDGIFRKAQRYISMIPATWITRSDNKQSDATSIHTNILTAAQTRRLIDEDKPVLADNLAILAQVHKKTVQNAISKNDLVLALPDKPGPTGSRKKPKYISASSALNWLTNPKRGKNKYFPTRISEADFSDEITQHEYSRSRNDVKIPIDKHGTLFLPHMYTKQGYLVDDKLYASYESALDALTKSDNPKWAADNPNTSREEFFVDAWIKMRKEDIHALILSSPFNQ